MRIAEWQWDDDNVPWMVQEVFAVNPRFRRNRKGRAATHQMVGPDAAGLDEVWRVITARDATGPEKDWWERS